MRRLCSALATAGVLALGLCAVSTVSAQAQDLNLDDVFRCAATDDAGKANCTEARGLILNNCTVCHTFVPIVMQGFDANGWHSLLNRHVQGGRISQLTEEQVAAIHSYLTDNFNGSEPPPDLPPELLSTWTSY